MVANDPAAREWFPAERVVADDAPGTGPLGGIAAGLAAANGSSIIVVAWDMPFVPPALLAALRQRGTPGVDAVVPADGSRREPLCAWYAASALSTCRALLDAGERRAGALAERLAGTCWLPFVEIEAFGESERVFTSVDTSARLAALGGALP